MRYHRIPDESIRRLPVYLRGLYYFAGQGLLSVSSTQLATYLHVSAAQVRKDLSYFGDFGTRGVGYDVEGLTAAIRDILKLSEPRKTVLVGAGNLGTALLSYPGFAIYGFEIVAVFDSSPQKIGTIVGGLMVESATNLAEIKKRKVQLAILAIPAEAAQGVTDILTKSGITGILNFAPQYLNVPKRVKVITIDIALELGRLPYYI
jgi:redox-sensing transcriptional repressor